MSRLGPSRTPPKLTRSSPVFHAPFILANSDKYTLSVIVERSATPEKSKARDAYPGVKVVNTLEEALKEVRIFPFLLVTSWRSIILEENTELKETR